MVFDTVHISTSIDRAAHDVYIYASNPRNLPTWARGLAHRDVEFVDDVGVIDSPLGRVTVEFAPPNPYGVLDHDVTLPSGEVVANPMRVIPNGDGCDVVFTVRRRAGVDDAEFSADADAVTADLAALRSLMQE